MTNAEENVWKLPRKQYYRPVPIKAASGLIFLLVLDLVFPSITYTIKTAPESQGNATWSVLHQAEEFLGNKKAVCGKVTATIADSFNGSHPVVANMDLSVDPCQDFYEFACGCWSVNNPIPRGKSAFDNFELIRQRNRITKKSLLEQPTEFLMSDAEKSAQRYYRSCVNFYFQSRDDLVTGIQKILDQIGGWPAIEDSNAKVKTASWNFQRALQTANNILHVDAFFKWGVSSDYKNSSRHVIQIDQGGLTLKANSYDIRIKENVLLLGDLLNTLTEMGMRLNIHADWYQLRLTMEDIIEVESRIASIWENENHFDTRYSVYTIADLQMLAPFLDWSKFFQSAFSSLPQAQVTISPSYSLIVNCRKYLERLSEMLNELLSTDRGTAQVRNYLAWRAIYAYMPNGFENSNGNDKKWRSCISDTNDVMGFAVSAMFVRQTSKDGEPEKLVKSMMNAIKKSFKKNLDNLDWLDEETRKAAKNKADAVTDAIGYPEFILNPKELDKYYSEFKVVDDYLMNKFQFYNFSSRQQLMKLNQPVTKQSLAWNDVKPSEVGAFYYSNLNEIVLPVGILQAPFFSTAFPDAFNFGALGTFLAHELTHGFDDDGRKFDLHGNLGPWWSDATTQRFEKRAECFVQQYAGYNINGQFLNGLETLDENIADNGGLRASFFAFNNWTANSPVRNTERDFAFLSVSDRNMTQEQMFFVSFAQAFCSSETAEALRFQIMSDVHSPKRYRVIGCVSNMPEFASAFQCPLGSPMNPEKKCEIW